MRKLSVEEAMGRRESERLAVSMLVGVLAAAACLLAAPSPASARTYPMHQCAPGTPAVSPGSGPRKSQASRNTTPPWTMPNQKKAAS